MPATPASLAPGCLCAEQVTPDHSVLSYRTRRGGISGWVVGLLEYVALEFYDKRLNITTLSSQEEGGVQTVSAWGT